MVSTREFPSARDELRAFKSAGRSQTQLVGHHVDGGVDNVK